MCNSLNQPMDFQVVFIIDMIANEVANAMKVDFVRDPLVGIFWNLRK